jgi:hypothetical protein
LLEKLKRKGEKLDPGERLSLYELMLDRHDPPEFADTFKTRLFELVMSF